MSELDDLKASVQPLLDAKDATVKALNDIAARVGALEGSTPAPGVLEGIATQIGSVTTALNAGATAAEATP